MTNHPKHNKNFIYLILFLMFNFTSHAQTGITQQALGTITASEETNTTKSDNISSSQKKKLLLDSLKTTNGKKLFEFFKKHPFHTFTARSLFTPAGTHIQYGGIGVALNGFQGSPFIADHSSQQYGGGGAVVLPLGDSDKIIGLALTAGEFGISNTNNNQNNSSGNFSLMLNRWINKDTMIVAGSSNLVPWGNMMTQLGKSYYGAVTHMWGLNINNSIHAVSASAGIGTGLFAPIGAVTNFGILKSNQDTTVYPFANLAYNVTPSFSIIGDYYSETFAVGASYVNLKYLPLSFVIYLGNLRQTETAPGLIYGLRIATSFSII